MAQRDVYIAGRTPALGHTQRYLMAQGVSVTDTPGWNTGDVLLDVPTFRPGGMRAEELDTLLSSLPRDIRLWGGNFHIDGYQCTDLLKDEGYLWENAAITARCTIDLTSPLLHRSWEETSVLILGWGRIGTYLARILRSLGCVVTVTARKETDLLRLRALGYDTASFGDLPGIISEDTLIINTVPRPVLRSEELPPGCINLDLASQKGIEGDDVIWARGLPGIHAPEESGKLIAQTYLRLRKENVS